MVHVEIKPEGNATARKIPKDALQAYYVILREWELTPRLSLPGKYLTHRLRNTRHLWTLKLTLERGHAWYDLRCVYQWSGSEINVLRFGHWRSIYENLPARRLP